jgi:hypothetical protein
VDRIRVNPLSKDILKNKKLLTRFARQIFLAPDTPAVIQVVASDAAYMVLTQAILHMESSKNLPFFRRLTAFYYRQGLNWPRLCQKLEPAAHALGLSPENSEPLDYYRLLGVTPATTESEIKKAYRIRAHATHPDAGSSVDHNSQAFVNVQAAYQTLSSPELRDAYNQSRLHSLSWREIPPGKEIESNLDHRARVRSRHVYQLISIILFLLLAAFAVEWFYK